MPVTTIQLLVRFAAIGIFVPKVAAADAYSQAAAFDAGIRLIGALATIGTDSPWNRPIIAADEIRVDGFDPGTLISLKNKDDHLVCRRTVDTSRSASCQNLEVGTYSLSVELRGTKKPEIQMPKPPVRDTQKLKTQKPEVQTAEVKTGTWTHFTVAGPAQDLPTKP